MVKGQDTVIALGYHCGILAFTSSAYPSLFHASKPGAFWGWFPSLWQLYKSTFLLFLVIMVMYKTTVKCDFGFPFVGITYINVQWIYVVNGTLNTRHFPCLLQWYECLLRSLAPFCLKVKYLGCNNWFSSFTSVSQPYTCIVGPQSELHHTGVLCL